MNERAPQRVVRLDPGALMTIDHWQEMLVQVQQGSVWVTEEGRLQDLVLGPGQWGRLAHRGRAIVTALDASEVALHRAERAERAGRGALFGRIGDAWHAWRRRAAVRVVAAA